MSSSSLRDKYAAAENGSRKLILMIGLGVTANILGMILGRQIMGALLERDIAPESESWGIVLGQALICVWALVALPTVGWLSVRFFEVTPTRFTFVAGLAGETFSLLLRLAVSGVDGLFVNALDIASEAFFVLSGCALTYLAGRHAEGKLAAAEQVVLAKQKANAAEMQAFVDIASAEKPKEAPVEPPKA